MLFRSTATRHVEEEPAGQLPGQIAQLLIGRSRQIGEQCEHGIRILIQALLDGRFVEFADLGRDLLELRIPGQFASRQRPLRCIGHGLIGRRTLLR